MKCLQKFIEYKFSYICLCDNYNSLYFLLIRTLISLISSIIVRGFFSLDKHYQFHKTVSSFSGCWANGKCYEINEKWTDNSCVTYTCILVKKGPNFVITDIEEVQGMYYKYKTCLFVVNQNFVVNQMSLI